jgi:glycosyltransferase involved in cell wall biosynthesis
VQDWDVWKRSGVYGLLDRVCSRLAARVTADGEGARRLAIQRQGMARDKLVTIYDGVNTAELESARSVADIRRELRLDPNRLTIGMIARLDLAKKAQDVFIAAARIVREKAPQMQFLIVGDGPDRAAVERMVSEFPTDARPVMAGYRTDLADMLRVMDVLVVPSRWESVPKILLEGMWLERPVVATRVGDIHEVLDDDCGTLVPSDAPEKLAEAILSIVQDSDLRARLGRAAHERIVQRRLTLADSIRAYERLYDGLR